ncbi:MAG: ABC transporter ATP-binding protein, partial [Thermoplasmata archaeon]|nr:ABC transporter ATP-binding protein [Thermoplasmata archaeon]
LALQDVDLNVGRGEFVALTGPNGSGKTTLLRLVLGLLAPGSGTVELFGTPSRSLNIRDRAKLVAWVPQEESPRDNVPVLEYITFGRYPHRTMFEGEDAADRELAQRVLTEVGLADRAKDGILELSGGERQRAVLGRAMAQEAPLLLLDEPTSHLDIGHQLDLLGRVRDLSRRRSTTVIAAMHDLNLAARFADRIVVLSRGRRVADGPPTNVLSEELLAQVWGVAADLRRDPRSGIPYLLPHSFSAPVARASSIRRFGPVHVVGGGGAASPILRSLVDSDHTVTTGALHLLDSDSDTAETLRLASAVEVPFAPLGDEVRERHRALLRAASAIVIAPFAVGPSNLANLEDVAIFLPQTPTWVFVRPPIGERDFTGGKASELVATFLRLGARPVDTIPQLLDEVAHLVKNSPAPLSAANAPA